MALTKDPDSVERFVDAHAADLVDFARELVSVATENPPGRGYGECVAVIEEGLSTLGLEARRIDLGDGRVAVLSGVGSGPTLYLHGHYDVVPASSPEQFRPHLRDGRLMGRGSADMKGAISAMAFALAAVAAIGCPGRTALVLVPDEETGGRLGAGRLLELGLLGRDGLVAVLGEPTSGVIWNANRGALTLRVTVSGRPAHVGLHYEGVNAFERAIPVVRALQELKREVESRQTRFRIEPEAARSSILMLGGELSGGHQFNVVPDRFSFTVERRFNPEEDLAEERERLLAVIGEASPADGSVDVSVIQQGDASSVAEEAGPLRVFRSAVTSVGLPAPEYRLCPGLLESRFYARAGVPAFAYGPGELEVSHGPEESVAVERLIACAKVYARFAVELFGGR